MTNGIGDETSAVSATRTQYQHGDQEEDTMVNNREDLHTKSFQFSILCLFLLTFSDEPFILSAGAYTYPFSFTLPTTMPASLELDENNGITYSVKAEIARPWKLDHKEEKPFEVVSYYDLNRFPNLSDPAKVTAEKYFCCLCCKSSPLTVVMTVPRTGFVCGEQIPVVIEVDNASSVNVNEITLAFRKVVYFFETNPTRGFHKEVTVLNKAKLGPVSQRSSKLFTNEMSIPSVPTTSLGHCSIIESDYQLYLKADVGLSHGNLKACILIVVGTVPFLNEANRPTGKDVGNAEASTMMMNSDSDQGGSKALTHTSTKLKLNYKGLSTAV